MIITSKVNMDLMDPGYPAIVNGVQDDRYTRAVEITLKQSEDDWPVPEDVDIRIRFCRADGSGGQYDTLPDGSPAWSAEENRLAVILAPQVLAIPGPVSLWISMSRETAQLSTFLVLLNVHPKADDSAGNSAGYVNVSGFLPGVLEAKEGQRLRIKAVREDGYVLALEAVDPEAAVLYTPQELTEEQKSQVRENIGAVSAGALTQEVEAALTEAKESGEFDGPPGGVGPVGPQGEAGYTPVKGEDYWTEEDQAEILEELTEKTTVEVGAVAYQNAYKFKVKVNGAEDISPAMKLVRYDSNQTKLTDEEKAQALTNIGAAPGIINTASGDAIALTDSLMRPLSGLKLFGKTTQDGTPTPEAPVPLVSAGDGGTLTTGVYGRNLFDENLFLSVTGWTVENGVYSGRNNELRTYFNEKQPVIFAPNTQYIFRFYAQAEAGKNDRIEIFYTDGTFSELVYRNSTELTLFEYVTDANKTIQEISIQYADIGMIGFKEFFIGVDTGSADYEPYITPQSLPLSTPNGLPGIPVTSGGNYTDSDGQQWICDEIDFVRGVRVRRVQEVQISDFSGSGEYYCGNGVTEGVVRTGVAVQPSTWHLCSHFPYSGAGYYARFAVLSNGNTYFTLEETLSQEEWRTRMTEISPIMQLILAEPVEEPLTAEELAAYAALYTNDPNTTILNDGGAGMEVSYSADTKRYIDNKFAQLAAAIVSG